MPTGDDSECAESKEAVVGVGSWASWVVVFGCLGVGWMVWNGLESRDFGFCDKMRRMRRGARGGGARNWTLIKREMVGRGAGRKRTTTQTGDSLMTKKGEMGAIQE